MRVHEFEIRADVDHKALLAVSCQTSRFLSDVNFITMRDEDEHTIDAKNLLAILKLSWRAGTRIRLISRGKDEEEALNYVFGFFESYV
ncbi:HPr family phosphocarrier protein [Paenibacillus aurantius]|uniref:HPr family phosphocarrier protein n=1 Tax=Paenibacillus aurantius TaxID=2918900 RepID=A0AA96LBQ3_9BACL|nr:HPr family phosphocarrier protein [Paenibacillus aurantius]WJH34908.1 HPr family phosphocarrier protein [Paenibacillus sp. CC-CFT747]WNQ10144.1 HPr family phosphocarrier protein [Paenibacillus aurantius]